MKAAIYEIYGGPEVVRVAEVPMPEPTRHEVRVEIHATTVSSGDWRMRSKEVPPSFRLIAPLIFGKRPKKRILGTELAGRIHSVGDGVTRWRAGDAVFAYPGSHLGAHAEYICMPEDGRIAKKPDNLSFTEAAALCFGGSTALSFIERADGIRANEHVLIVGATGTVGSAMLQLAKLFGAKVTVVCSTPNRELAVSLGADDIIDYTKEDFTKRAERYDVIVDNTGTAPVSRCKQVLRRGGRILIVNGSLPDMVRSAIPIGTKVVAGPANEDVAHLPRLAQWAEEGRYKPLIDSIFPFEQIVDAHRRVDTGHKRGSVVVSVRSPS
ncbi:MAG: NAD(P)-dependent alcohol dehydrogenase [Deltaproteobacteria bacterium]|nr:NAD(P)-dependent alcohol dehydrogenase [Deltaproteobacteria bacterium]